MRRTLILAALAGLLLAPAAHAHGIATLVVSGATYEPGAEVTVNGQFVDPEIAALSAPATVTLGIDGPILGQAPIAADGTWALTFVLPQAVAVGTYVLQASVVGADGGLVTPLLARAGLVVTSPVPGSSAQPPVEDGSNETGGLPADTVRFGDAGFAAPVVVPAATTPVAPAATIRRPVAVPAGAVAPKPVLHTPARPAAQRRPPAQATPPVRAVVRPESARNVKPVSRPRRTAPVVAAPARPPAAAAPRQARPVVTVSPRTRAPQRERRSSTSSPVPRPNPLQPLLIGAAALLLLLAAAGTFAFLQIRRRRTLAAIELELQQLLAEENARRDSPVTVSA